ncbi:hypothetical protein [Flavobacterium fluviatile]|nr:hypothetical protein [Flavobacterium fluviatile]
MGKPTQPATLPDKTPFIKYTQTKTKNRISIIALNVEMKFPV